MRQFRAEAAELQHRLDKLRDRPIAIAWPVGRAILSHGLDDVDAMGGGDVGIDGNNDAWDPIGEPILRSRHACAAELRRRSIKLRHRPLANACPVGRAILAHGLGYFDFGGGHEDEIDRHHAAWKTIDDSILRPCLPEAAGLRQRRIE